MALIWHSQNISQVWFLSWPQIQKSLFNVLKLKNINLIGLKCYLTVLRVALWDVNCTHHSQTRRLLSSDVLTKRRFSSTKVMVLTAPRWRSYSWTTSPVLMSHCHTHTGSKHGEEYDFLLKEWNQTTQKRLGGREIRKGTFLRRLVVLFN